MRIIKKKTLIDFWNINKDSQSHLESWYFEVKNADWSSPAEIKEKYKSASILKDSRVVFNIKGNDYRLVVKINYNFKVVYIRFVGTHKEYDKTDVENI